MNERIRQLVRQANELDYETFDEYNHKTVQHYKFNKEKFAELIVSECSKVIVNGGYWSGGPLGPKRQCTPPEIAQMVKEHFGVEQ